MPADPQHPAGAAHTSGLQDEMQAEMQELARKLLDLWQDHISALAQDPTLMAQALKLMSAYSPFPWPQPGMAPTGGPGFAPFAPGFAAGFPFGGGDQSPAAPAGPAPAAAAPDAGAGTVGELRRRLAELEGRMAQFEQGGHGQGGGTAKPTRKRAPRKRPESPRAPTSKGG